MKRIIPIVFFILLLIGCNEKPANQTQPAVSSEITIKNVKLAGLNGQPVDLSQYKGKTVFINFWATWCKPCVVEMPSLQRLTEKLKTENIVFLFASDETAEEIEDFKTTKGFALEFVRVENLDELGLMGLPTTFIFNKDAKLAFSEMGAREWDSEESIELITKITKQ